MRPTPPAPAKTIAVPPTWPTGGSPTGEREKRGRTRFPGCGPAVEVELRGLEPLTPTLPVWCATSCAIAPY